MGTRETKPSCFPVRPHLYRNYDGTISSRLVADWVQITFSFWNEMFKNHVYRWNNSYILLACLANNFYYFIFKEKLVHLLDCSYFTENGILQRIQTASAGQSGRQSATEYTQLLCNCYFIVKNFATYIRQVQNELATFKDLRAAEGKCLDKLLIRCRVREEIGLSTSFIKRCILRIIVKWDKLWVTIQ